MQAQTPRIRLSIPDVQPRSSTALSLQIPSQPNHLSSPARSESPVNTASPIGEAKSRKRRGSRTVQDILVAPPEETGQNLLLQYVRGECKSPSMASVNSKRRAALKRRTVIDCEGELDSSRYGSGGNSSDESEGPEMRRNPAEVLEELFRNRRISNLMMTIKNVDLDLVTNPDLIELAILILKKPPDLRINYEMNVLQRCTAAIEFFNRYDPVTVERCLRCMKYVCLEAGDTVFKAGTIGSKFYVIVKGSVTVVTEHEKILAIGKGGLKVVERHEVDTKIMTAGSAFGELAMLDSKLRTATVRCRERCEFAVLDRAQFKVILREKERQYIYSQVDYLVNLPAFKELPYHAIHWLLYNLEVKKFVRGQVVYDEGDQADSMYIIKAGDFKVVKIMHIKAEQEEDVNDPVDKFMLKSIVKKAVELAILSKQETFGEEDLLSHDMMKRKYRVVCSSLSGEVLVITKEKLEARIFGFKKTMRWLRANTKMKEDYYKERLKTTTSTVGSNGPEPAQKSLRKIRIPTPNRNPSLQRANTERAGSPDDEVGSKNQQPPLDSRPINFAIYRSRFQKLLPSNSTSPTKSPPKSTAPNAKAPKTPAETLINILDTTNLIRGEIISCAIPKPSVELTLVDRTAELNLRKNGFTKCKPVPRYQRMNTEASPRRSIKPNTERSSLPKSPNQYALDCSRLQTEIIPQHTIQTVSCGMNTCETLPEDCKAPAILEKARAGRVFREARKKTLTDENYSPDVRSSSPTKEEEQQKSISRNTSRRSSFTLFNETFARTSADSRPQNSRSKLISYYNPNDSYVHKIEDISTESFNFVCGSKIEDTRTHTPVKRTGSLSGFPAISSQSESPVKTNIGYRVPRVKGRLEKLVDGVKRNIEERSCSPFESARRSILRLYSLHSNEDNSGFI